MVSRCFGVAPTARAFQADWAIGMHNLEHFTCALFITLKSEHVLAPEGRFSPSHGQFLSVNLSKAWACPIFCVRPSPASRAVKVIEGLQVGVGSCTNTYALFKQIQMRDLEDFRAGPPISQRPIPTGRGERRLLMPSLE